MALEEEKHNEDQSQNSPSAEDLFVGPVHEALVERDVFVGDEDFYESLSSGSASRANDDTTQRVPYWNKLRLLKLVTVAAIGLTGAVLIRHSIKGTDTPAITTETTTRNDRASQARKEQPEVKPAPDESQQTAPQSESAQDTMQRQVLPDSQPVSLKIAQGLYRTGEYDKAHAAFARLTAKLSDRQANKKNILRFQMAMCHEHAGRSGPAAEQLDSLSRSLSPTVRMLACYNLGVLQLRHNSFVRARRNMYKALSLVNLADLDRNLMLGFQRDGNFLTAEAITRNILALSNMDRDLPPMLWPDCGLADPFSGLNEQQLDNLARSGLDVLETASLAPRVKQITHEDGSMRWSVICYGSSIEELLARFAVEAGLDITWGGGNEQRNDPNHLSVKQRPLTLYLPAATAQQVITIAAGHAGLVARIEDRSTVAIGNPQAYTSLTDHLHELAEHTISLWQRFLLGFYGDERSENVHLILGLLQDLQDRPAEALAEYKLVANRFSNSPLAPYALLYSSKIKADLRDYIGARRYLQQLVEQYPDSQITDRSYMTLADMTLQAGLLDEAAKAFSRVYSLTLSDRSRTDAALGAGKCYYRMSDHESAIRWLMRYIESAKHADSEELWIVYYMIGKSHLAQGRSRQACQAFQYALQGKLSREQYIETISALVDSHMEQERYIEALSILEDMKVRRFSQKDSVKITLLKSKVLRAMGLFENAIATLGDKAEYTLDSTLTAQIALEIANCHIDQQNWPQAEKTLSNILVSIEAGPLADRASIALARVCLKLRRESQTIRICRRLLDGDLDEPDSSTVLKLLAQAYRQQQDFERAALALLGKWKQDDDNASNL